MNVHRLGVAMMLMVLSSCVLSRQPYRGNGEWKTRRDQVHEVIIFPPHVTIEHLDEAGTYSLRPEASRTAQAHLQDAAQQALQRRLGAAITVVDESIDPAWIQAVQDRFDRLNQAIIAAHYSDVPASSAFSPSMDSALHAWQPAAEVAVFISAYDLAVDVGHRARRFADDLNRSGYGPAEDSAASDRADSKRGLSIALVRVRDGAVVWYAYHSSSRTLRLNDPAAIREIVTDLLRKV